ncbi:DUF2935 domain-containing protein [Bacillus sp. OV322]|uniref:DUF2935 domain-containing protein n=1 Tax=Bacillus sp. OV322 TaxID=1882764 RepID=UPI000B8307D4|nr:DUF2935 domain-containing protein [Bacillus sp. OV322]
MTERGDYVPNGFEKAAKFENGFWLQILGDHARFIHDSLVPQEKEWIDTANYFIQTFDQLLSCVEGGNLVELSVRAEEETIKLREYKLKIMEHQLVGKISIHLSPVFFNHMVNELEEYLLVLKYLKKGEVPPIFHELHHHLIWLFDAAGHAGAISNNLEWVEKRIKNMSDDFAKVFEAFYLKAVELTGFLRTNITSFPALKRFNKDVSLEMKLFMNFLNEIEELRLSKEALGTFAALMADHMFREECYYLMKLAESTQADVPDCNPAKPRLQE